MLLTSGFQILVRGEQGGGSALGCWAGSWAGSRPRHVSLGEPLPYGNKQICPLRGGYWSGSWESEPQQNACHSLDLSRNACVGCLPRAVWTRPGAGRSQLGPEDMGGK